jgi:2-polyprenyl-3-methyl-5-hydroxy-6-metoxy-1,4-benzoquinol methylase
MSKAQAVGIAADPASEILEIKRKARDLLEQGEPEKAEKILQKALEIETDAPDILYLLGRCAHAMENLSLAVEYYNRTLRQVEMAEAYNAMAEAFITPKQGDDVLKVVERAERAGVANYDTMVRKGFGYLLKKDVRNSLYTFMKAIGQQPQNRDARVFTSTAIRAGGVPNYNIEFQQALLSCLQSDDMEHYTLGGAWIQQIKEDPAAKAAREIMAAKDYDSFLLLYSQPQNRSYILSPFFRFGMEKLVVLQNNFEQFLKHLRRFYLETVHTADELSSEEHVFICSLATYCFLTEYAMSIGPEEQQIVNEMRARIEGRKSHFIAEEVAIYSSYEPLNTLKNAKSVAASGTLCRHEVGRLIKLQIDEPAEEAKIKKTIKQLVPIDDDISKKVQAQYESNPYPRWISCNRITPLQDRHLNKKKIKMLIAGCGTGRQVIHMASIFPAAEITAMDLSSSSIAYAIRKCREYNIDTVDFRQGDILNLGSALQPESFDRVECTGVLHHMNDPMAGWRVITSLMKPTGIMTIGLYSEYSRRGIVKAREMIKEKGFTSSLEDIRKCRDYMLTLPESDLLRKLTMWRDFYSVSDCRDLLFHVQEHRFTLLQIKDCLNQLGLEFAGFSALKPEQTNTYRKVQPEGPMLDLDLWHRLEEEDNDLFFSIYQFKAYKKGLKVRMG